METLTYMCPNCGNDLIECGTFSEFDDNNGWCCKKCKEFYGRKEIKRMMVFNV